MLVDDHHVVRRGLKFFLQSNKEISIVAECDNGEVALKQLETVEPDVVLMDLSMPVMDGITATKLIKERFPSIKVLVLSSFSDQDHIIPALQAGAIGYLLKDSEPEQLVEAIRGAIHGNVQLHPEISKQLLMYNQVAQTAKQEMASEITTNLTELELFEALTNREKEVLKGITEGLSNKEIAAALEIAEKTVKVHVSNILGKLQVYDRTQAAVLAIKHKLVD